jgi:hypothetical protein
MGLSGRRPSGPALLDEGDQLISNSPNRSYRIPVFGQPTFVNLRDVLQSTQ